MRSTLLAAVALLLCVGPLTHVAVTAEDAVFVNKDAWNGLDDASKATIMDCGEKAGAAGDAKSRELTAQYLKTLAENGMTVSAPSDQLKSDLQGFGATMAEEWIESAGDKGKAIIDAYKAM